MKGNTPYLVVNGLKKHYGDGEARVQVLDGITASVNKGEICVMLGPSGLGKSTFLNLIGGLEDVDGGSIAVASWASSSSSITSYPTSRSGRTSRSPRTSPRTPAHGGPSALARPLGTSQQVPAPGLRWPAAALRHRSRPRQESGPHPVRRAHGRARLQDLQGGPRAHGAREPRVRLHPRDRDAQRHHRQDGRPRTAPSRRPSGLRRGQCLPRVRLRARLAGAR